MEEKLEIIVGNETLKVDEFITYAYEQDFFAVANNNLYYKKLDDTYELLGKDYVKPKVFTSVKMDLDLFKKYEHSDHEPYTGNDKLEE